MRPRLAFLGLGWIGGLRLDAVREAGVAEVAALCDPAEDRLAEHGERSPDAARFPDLDALLAASGELGLDGVVVATPNALHTKQALAILERDLPVFVQKPLGIHPGQVEDVLSTARERNLPVGVDLSYRGLTGARELRRMVAAGELGEVFQARGSFHNAYGPDKAWCFDPEVAGGGALLDLGVHLVDLILWCLDHPRASEVGGWTRDLEGHPGIDGFGVLHALLEEDTRLRVEASWHGHTGRDCDIRLELDGTEGSALLRNTGGSFYDFELLHRRGRREERVVEDHRSWMDRPVVEWAEGVGAGAGFDTGAWTNLTVARLLEAVYRPEATLASAASGASGASELPEASASSSGTR